MLNVNIIVMNEEHIFRQWVQIDSIWTRLFNAIFWRKRTVRRKDYSMNYSYGDLRFWFGVGVIDRKRVLLSEREVVLRDASLNLMLSNAEICDGYDYEKPTPKRRLAKFKEKLCDDYGRLTF